MLLWYNRYGFLYTCARRAILMNQERLNDLNTAYYRLETKQAEIIHALSHGIFELESGWYNGHYHKGDNDNWVRESYPMIIAAAVVKSAEESAMLDWLKKTPAIDPEAEKARLMKLSEKELLAEMILELKRISEKCDEIGRKIVIWSN